MTKKGYNVIGYFLIQQAILAVILKAKIANKSVTNQNHYLRIKCKYTVHVHLLMIQCTH